MSERGPYDRDENPCPGEPLHVQLLAKSPDTDDFACMYDEFVAELDLLSRLALEPAPSSPTPVDSGASPKPAFADAQEPSLLSGASARGHNRKA
jgi:hypothetical protein